MIYTTLYRPAQAFAGFATLLVGIGLYFLALRSRISK
jgi:hypothetical protein